MSDIFGYNRSGRPQAVFSSDKAHFTVEGKGEGYMIQQWDFTYQQNVQEIFELGSSNLYWVRGQPQGQGTIGRIIGGGTGIDLLVPDSARDICSNSSTSVDIEFNPGECVSAAGATGANRITLDGVVITSVGFNSSVQDMMIRQNLQIRFAKMSI